MNTYFVALYKWWLYSYFLYFLLYIHTSYLILKYITFLWGEMELLWFVSSITGVSWRLQVAGWGLIPADTQDTSHRRNFEPVSGLRSGIRPIYIARFLKAPKFLLSSATQRPHISSFSPVFLHLSQHWGWSPGPNTSGQSLCCSATLAGWSSSPLNKDSRIILFLMGLPDTCDAICHPTSQRTVQITAIFLCALALFCSNEEFCSLVSERSLFLCFHPCIQR